jgi:hypothetical protein
MLRDGYRSLPAHLPRYVTMRGTELRLIVEDGKPVYYRDAGSWRVSIREEGGKIFSVFRGKKEYDHMDGVELIKSSRDKYKLDNSGYLPAYLPKDN